MPEEESKYPIGDAGENFQPDAMEDFDRRVQSGEFAKLTMDEIRRVYVNEEIDFVQHQEEMEMLEEQNRREEQESDQDD
jgi:hypothetical protein